ncbi:MAG: patatin-like phospholipase family protein [Chitinophagaceae bacterium]
MNKDLSKTEGGVRVIKNLAIKGGGVKGVAYVGAIKELHKAGLFTNIQRFSGSSAGALLACMICAGYNVDEIEELMRSIQFKKFKKGWNPLRIFTGYGLYSGKYILDFVRKFLRQSPFNKTNPPPLHLTSKSTFMDMKNAGCKELYVFACNTNMHDVTEFSADKTPHVMVAEAIRASMSIPYFFKAWKFTDNRPNDHIYIDGGVVYNYPLTFFDHDRFNKMEHENLESAGLYLFTPKRVNKTPLRFFQVFFFTKHLFESLLETQDYVVIQDKEQLQRSIMIDDLKIPATDFNITHDQMSNLIESGSRAAKKYIHDNNLVAQDIKL